MDEEAAIREELARVLDEINPAWGYAMRKLGYMVTEMNRESFTPAEVKAWDDAVEEYDEL